MPIASLTDSRNWEDAPIAELIAHVRAAYHQPLTEELQQVALLADRVAERHGDVLPMLGILRQIVVDLGAILERHLQNEDRVLFPAILELASNPGRRAGDPHPLAVPIAAMNVDHDRATEALERLRAITSGYEPPEWACPTFRALYDRLSQIEHRMRLHLHLENDVLFPRALSLGHPRGA